MKTWTVYNLGLSDCPSEDKKIAVFYEYTKAIQYVEYMGSLGERYGVFDNEGIRIDTE